MKLRELQWTCEGSQSAVVPMLGDLESPEKAYRETSPLLFSGNASAEVACISNSRNQDSPCASITLDI